MKKKLLILCMAGALTAVLAGCGSAPEKIPEAGPRAIQPQSSRPDSRQERRSRRMARNSWYL